MNRPFCLLFLVLATFPARSDPASQWLTDVPTALQKARQENKAVLLDFTGSDWCGWCIKLKREVFDQPEFTEFAKTNLVLVELDFPHHKTMDPAQQETNKHLAETYHVTGFPTLVLLNREGQPLDELVGYLPGGPRSYNEKLARLLNVELKNANAPEATQLSTNNAVVFRPVPVGVPIRYESLALKGISGSKQRRLALINNATFVVGETAKVKVQDQRVEVCCKEIREDSVLVTADGKPLELKLGNH
jgi:thioredoxin-related protein